MTDQLQGSPVLAEVLGDALPKLERFHAKIAEEGEPRGLIGPRADRATRCRYYLGTAYSEFRCDCAVRSECDEWYSLQNSCRRRQWWWFSWIGGCRVFAGS